MNYSRVTLFILISVFTGVSCSTIQAQQFNSDNYLTMPKGTGTFILTAGERNAGFISSFALINRFEFFAQTGLFWDHPSDSISQHFTLNLYGKYMFWLNKDQTGGGGVFLGYGSSPSYYQSEGRLNVLNKNIWTSVAVTFPFFNNRLTWDLMPGALVDFEYGEEKETAWGFTYSTRVTFYPVKKLAIVGEAFGTAGSASSPGEYRVGLRYEPNDFIVPAITYGNTFNEGDGAGLEIGIMIFSPPFIQKGFIRNNHIKYDYTRQKREK